MNGPWQNIGRGKRMIAIFLAVLAISSIALIHTSAEYFISCALLLFAWNLAFIPSPSIKSSMKDVYDASLRGWRTPMTSKLVSLLATILFVVGVCLQVAG